MTTLKYLMEREQNLVDRKQENFDDRVQILYRLDEDFKMSDDERNKFEEAVRASDSYEKALDTELKQVRASMKRYILKLLEL